MLRTIGIAGHDASILVDYNVANPNRAVDMRAAPRPENLESRNSAEVVLAKPKQPLGRQMRVARRGLVIERLGGQRDRLPLCILGYQVGPNAVTFAGIIVQGLLYKVDVFAKRGNLGR